MHFFIAEWWCHDAGKRESEELRKEGEMKKIEKKVGWITKKNSH